MTVAVIGGGLSGAFAARALELAGKEVVVLDAADEPGGVAVPVRREGYLLEPAAGSLLLPHPHLTPLLDGLDVSVHPATPAARNRFVRHQGRTVKVAPGPQILATPLVSVAGKARVLAETFVRSTAQPDESVEGFLSRRLGSEAGRLAATLMAGGVHGGDPSQLSIGAAFPRLLALENRHGSLLKGVWANRKAGPPTRPSTHVVDDGVASVAAAVAASLGDRWRRSWSVQKLEPTATGWRIHGPETLDADRVVAAIAPEELAEIFPSADTLLGSEWSPVAAVFLGLKGPTLPEGIGVLAGPDEGLATMGFLYESAYAPSRAPSGRGLVKAIVGGTRRPDVVELADEVILSKVTAELEAVLGEPVDVDMTHVVRQSIPQYTPTRRRMIDSLPEVLPTGLDVVGWAYNGVGLTNLATAAMNLAQ